MRQAVSDDDPFQSPAAPPDGALDRRVLAEVLVLRRQVGAIYRRLVQQPAGPAAPESRAEAEQAVPPADQLYATFFGTFGLQRGGARLALGRERPILELCRYLVARAGQPVSRDELLELLWPEAAETRATHRLHVAVSGLRRLLDVPGSSRSVLTLEDDSYLIAALGLAKDVGIPGLDLALGQRAGQERSANGLHYLLQLK